MLLLFGWMLLLVEALVAEARGAASPGQVAWVAAWVALPWAALSILFSAAVSVALWSAGVVAIYAYKARARPDEGPQIVADAWTEASQRFQLRRLVLGRHYSWRVAWAALPHLIILLALCFLLLGLVVGALGTAGLTAGSPETAVLGVLFGTLFTLVGLLIAFPAVFGVFGVFAAPLVRGPLARLLAELTYAEEQPPAQPTWLGAAFTMWWLDLALYLFAFVWAGVSLIGPVFSILGSASAALLGVCLAALLWGRILLGDALVLEGNQVKAATRRTRRAMREGAFEIAQLGLLHLGAVGAGLGLPLVGLAGAMLSLWMREASAFVILAVALVGIVVLARLSSAGVIRLALHRLMVLRALTEGGVARAGGDRVGGSGGRVR